jgi:hypothetical protein
LQSLAIALGGTWRSTEFLANETQFGKSNAPNQQITSYHTAKKGIPIKWLLDTARTAAIARGADVMLAPRRTR